jgi:glycosyltransferase involved in cell wall biosynthesis
MRIALITPYGREHRNGNWHTAARWARFLRDAGHAVRVQTVWDRRDADLMLALHARRSFASIEGFAQRFPSRPLLLELPPRLAAKARVIYQSAPDIPRGSATSDSFNVLVVGHLRAEKDPFRPALATSYLPEHSRVRVTHLGGALSPDMAETASLAQSKLPRWQWLGEVPHKTVLKHLGRADLMVISSVMEGGANVVCEALAADVPVLASRMPGNIGMLGERYPGYFPVGDERELARLMSLAEIDHDFYAELIRQGRKRRVLMRPEHEASRLRQAVAEFEQTSG